MRRLPSGGTKARQAPSKEPARCSWKIGGRGLLLLLGLVLALAACSSDPELTIVTEADPEPVEEAPGSPGLHAFRDLSVQLEEFATDSSGETSSETARDDFAERPGAITDLTVGLPSEEAIKSGLYGGTAENTCRPEKLIQFLLDNPSKGQVWADVQGIRFVDIPDYIRTLKPTVLTEAVTVLNHGFDPKGHAIPIVSTLAEGTAVLVDENGDVRTRCYCGNPILPYTPVDYTPPKCLSHYAVVYVSPNNRESLVSVPRSVRATKNIATYDRVRWTEIAWGTDDKTGWVRTHEAQDRYCKPPETISCVGSSDVLAQPAGTRSVGSITNAHISILTPDVEGWTLIKFGPRSGWIRTSQLNDDTCNYDVDCVEVSSGTWTQPGRQGQQFVPAGYAQTLRLTGQTIVVNGDAFLQAYVMYPAPTRIGYVRAQDITELPATDCEPGQVCTPFDQDIPVYVDSTGTTTIGWMWFGQKPVISGPTNGRYEIDFAGTQGWIDLGDLNTAAPSDCPPEVRCIEFLDDAYVAEPPSSGRVGVPIGVPTLVTFTGDVYGSQQNPTYHKFHTTNIATAWVETSVGYKVLDDADCLSGPICRDNGPEHQPCRVECVTEFNVGLEGEFGWQAKAIWSSTSYPLNLKFLWPSGLPAVQKLHYPGLSGATSFLPGPVLQGPIPQNGRPVQLEWTNPNTQQVGVIDCEINWCTIVPFEADFGEFFELFELIPEDLSCLEVECAIDTSEWQVPNTGGPTGANITWTNTPASSDPPIDFHFNWGGTSYVDEQQVGKTGGSTSSTSLQGSTFVTVTWFGPDGQVGTLDCVGCVDDVIYADGAHICCREGEPELGESGRCCNIPDVPLPDGSYCCPPEDLETRNCCPDERFVDVSPEFCERAVVVGQPVKPVPITPTPTPTPTPTATPPPPITPTPTATPTPPGICEEPPLIYWNEDLQKCVGWKVVPIPATPVPPPTTATAVPLPTVTPGPVCELGVGPNGECISYCDPGDLLTTRTCVCEAPGTQEGADGIQCEIVCPAGQINLTTTLCGVPEVPTAVVQPTVEVPRCTAPLRWNEVLQQCTD